MHEARDTVQCEKAGFSTVHGRYSIETRREASASVGVMGKIRGDDFVLLHWGQRLF